MPQRANVPALRRWLLLSAATGAAALALAQPASARSDDPQPAPTGAPKSLLPDDIAEPVTPPTGAVEGAVSTFPGNAPAPLQGFEPLPPAELPLPELPEPEPSDPLAELAGPTAAPEQAGLLTPTLGGYRPDLFAGSDARFLSALLARIDGPLASRWGQIVLQRALLSAADAPGPVNPADWVAARASALVRLGASADAHRLVSRIAIDRYTAPLYGAAVQAAVAAGDPMALCPLSPLARAVTESPTWVLADAMCLSILGDEVGASVLFDRLRRSKDMSAFDIGLAERVASATGGSRRGANPEWEEAAGGLTAWRMGLASAAGLEIPADLLGAATPAQKAWYVRLPGQSLDSRAGFAAAAAATGALSTDELNRILAAQADGLDQGASTDGPGGRLRTANLAVDVGDRIAAMEALWKDEAADSLAAYGWQLATARAAARIAPSAARAADAPGLVASLLAAGIAPAAERWWPAMSDAAEADRAAVWALLASVSGNVPVETGLYDSWAKTVPAHRAQLLAAGLDGLGRGSTGAEITALDNDWTRALDRAVEARRTGEVMLIAASGLRGAWAEVPPDYLRRIARALVAMGHAPEARLIVAEAATRG
jgi:hypothetical protein